MCTLKPNIKLPHLKTKYNVTTPCVLKTKHNVTSPWCAGCLVLYLVPEPAARAATVSQQTVAQMAGIVGGKVRRGRGRSIGTEEEERRRHSQVYSSFIMLNDM